MVGKNTHRTNEESRVEGMHRVNLLGPHIEDASLVERGDGGSWCTCILGADQEPPQDVAHVQFRSRVAFKLVWSPVDDFGSFALVSDSGELLAHGTPTGAVPSYRERMANYEVVKGGRFATAAEKLDVAARADETLES